MSARYLVMGRPRVTASPSDLRPRMRAELEYVWRAYREGSIRELYETETGVVLLVEAAGRAEVDRLVERLPLAEAGLLEIEVHELRPFAMWSQLFALPVPD